MLKEKGTIEERTVFAPTQVFTYKLSRMDEADIICANFEGGNVHVILPPSQSSILTDSEEITIQGYQKNGEDGDLFILVEKDLKCLDHSLEDQSDMYDNPNTTC